MQSVLAPLIGPAGPEQADLNGKVAIVTGGALGIGYEISRHLALMGCRVIMSNRKKEQGDEAISKIKAEKADAKIEWVGCDLGTLKEVKEVYGGLASKLDRLDLLFLNAGINANKFGTTNDGLDRHFGVNALGNFYVLNLLYPLLRKTSKLADSPKGSVRVVLESSEMHRMSPASNDSASRGRGVHFGSEEEITEGGSTMGPIELYGRTKLALILYGKALRDKVITKNGDDIYVVSVHPGTVDTPAQNAWPEAYGAVVGGVIQTLATAVSRSEAQGSYSALYAALSPDIVEKEWNGVYLGDVAKLGGESAQAQDANLATALWELSERLIQKVVGQDALSEWGA
ncbi:hypothetical protein P7C73_g3667, partial [Tremellales sp. Uapishka_1]